MWEIVVQYYVKMEQNGLLPITYSVMTPCTSKWVQFNTGE